MRLAQRRAVITGGSSGLGLAIAQAFVSAGASVLLCGRRSDALEAARERFASTERVHTFAADVTKRDEVQRLMASADELGGIDILVNAAGMAMTRPADELTDSEWDEVHDVNVRGTVVCCQEAFPLLRSSRGCIVNVGSLTSFVAIPGRLAYASTKGAIVTVTRTLAVEWAPHGVRVNALIPGYIDTPLLREIERRGLVDFDALAKRTPLGRLGTPEDVAGPAVFLASDESTFVTGHCLAVDGGWLAYGFV